MGFAELLLLPADRPAADRGASTVLERDAGGDRRARPGAQRAGGAHDVGRGARCAAGRGRGRHPGLRLGDPRRLGDGRALFERDRSRRDRERRRPAKARRALASCAPAREREARSPATAIRCTRSATRASTRCSRCARGGGADMRFVAIAEAVEAVIPQRRRQGPAAQRLGRDPGGAARRRLSGRRAEGRADPGAHRRPDRAPERGARPADRLRAVVPGHARDASTTERRAAADRLRREAADT